MEYVSAAAQRELIACGLSAQDTLDTVLHMLRNADPFFVKVLSFERHLRVWGVQQGNVYELRQIELANELVEVLHAVDEHQMKMFPGVAGLPYGATTIILYNTTAHVFQTSLRDDTRFTR